MTEAGARTILDFGLHRGEDSAFYLALGARVVAFEAHPDLLAYNRGRFADAIAGGRLEIVAGAIVAPDDAAREVTFYVDSQKSVWGTTSADWAERNRGLGSTTRAVTVPAVDLPAVLAANPQPLYAKIDIEGADGHVLAALGRAGVSPEFVSIESDKLSLEAVVAEIEQLQALGYTRFAAVQQATVPGRRFRGHGLDGRAVDHRFEADASGPFGPWLEQPWKTAGAVIDDYRVIFRRYRRFGDGSALMRHRLTRLPTRGLNQALIRLAGAPLCGWYDTHAAR
jgi:FkbM family methyltransferase